MEKITHIITGNNNYIYGIYDDKIIALLNLLDLIINQLNILLRIVERTNYLFPDTYIDNFKIITLKNNSNVILNQCYFFFENFTFCDSDKGIDEYFKQNSYAFTTKINQIKMIYNRIQHFKDSSNNTTELNIFIPHGIDNMSSDSDKNINDDHNIDTNENKQIIEKQTLSTNIVDKDKLLEEIKQLENEKEKEKENLILLKKDLKLKEKVYIKEKRKLESEKRNLKMTKEKWEEFLRVFGADKKIYYIMKEQLTSGKINISDIPSQFKHKYDIFEFIDNNKFTNTKSELYYYIDKLPKQHLDFEPSQKYKHIFDDGIDPFFDKCNKKSTNTDDDNDDNTDDDTDDDNDDDDDTDNDTDDDNDDDTENDTDDDINNKDTDEYNNSENDDNFQNKNIVE